MLWQVFVGIFVVNSILPLVGFVQDNKESKKSGRTGAVHCALFYILDISHKKMWVKMQSIWVCFGEIPCE